MNNEVTALVKSVKHPMEAGINDLRNFILTANNRLTENIKWNGPNYVFKGQDRITMRVQMPKLVQLIFHRGATVREDLQDKLISDESGLLEWKSNDRAVITFKSPEEIESGKEALKKIINEWLSKD